MTELELCKYEGKHIKVICTDGDIVQGECYMFTQALDNEPEVASITIRNQNGLIEIELPEIKEIIEI